MGGEEGWMESKLMDPFHQLCHSDHSPSCGGRLNRGKIRCMFDGGVEIRTLLIDSFTMGKDSLGHIKLQLDITAAYC